MKKIITIAILLFSMASYAQGNLQFNQVRTYAGQGSKIFDTVPTGKVWKIESMGISGGQQTGYLTINGFVYSNVAKDVINSSVYEAIKETIWLKAGDRLGWSGVSGNNGLNTYAVSIIEYNIVQ